MNDFNIDKKSPIPYYYQIEEWIRSQITSGRLQPGDMLSNEISLSEQLGVSRMTVRQALNHLTQEGLLTRYRAKGTFVAPPRQQVPFVLDRLRSMTEEVASQGRLLRSHVLALEVLTAAGEICHELNMETSEPMILIRRLRSVDEVPISIESSYHPYRRFPELLQMDLNDGSIYEILDHKFHSRPVEAVDTIVASVASREEAALLEIDEGAPVMIYKRIGKDADGLPMEFTRAVYRADRYQFVIRYKRP
jgi:GntR family transcriptional regulator